MYEIASPYGSIAGLKLARPEDGEDQASVPPPTGAKILFDGKSLQGWKLQYGDSPSRWRLRAGGIAEASSYDIQTREVFAKPYRLHVEFRVPRNSSGPPSDSGIFLQGRHEIQIFDSYGRTTQSQRDCGGIMSLAAPNVDACKAPTVWQTFDIDFTPAVCGDGKVAEGPIVTVRLNGVMIHDKVEIPVGKNDGGACSPGPVCCSATQTPPQFRNIWMVERVDPSPADKKTSR